MYILYKEMESENAEIRNRINDLKEDIGGYRKLFDIQNPSIFDNFLLKQKIDHENMTCGFITYVCRCCHEEVEHKDKLKYHLRRISHKQKMVKYNQKIDKDIEELRNKIFLLEDELECIKLKSQ